MSLAVQADSGRDFWSAPSSSAPLKKRLLLASVAITGASVIAVTPVASNLPALEIAQQRAVDLVAFENPFAVLGGTFGKAFGNLSNRGGEINATLIPNLSAILGNKELQRELSVILFRPETVAQQLQDRLAEHQETLRLGYEQSQAGWAAHNELLPGVLERAQAELLAGRFTEAFAHVNDWFIFGLGAAGWPLYPSFAVPGQVARDVGGPAIAAILDALLVGDTTLVGYPHAILVPFVSAIFRFTDSLDEIHVATQAGDVVTALSHMVNLPVKVLGAFLNGYSPSIAEDWNVFPGFLTPGGPIDTFLVQYPTMIAKALGLIPKTATTAEVPAEASTEALSKVSSTEVASDAKVITLSLDTAAEAGTPAESVSNSTETDVVTDTADETVTDAEAEAPAEAPAEPVATETATETVKDETVKDETVKDESATETVKDEAAAGTGDAKEDSKADAKADDKADSKADDKADSKADAKADSKADAKADSKADSKADAKADSKADAKSDKSDSKSSSTSSSSSSSNSGSSSE